MVRLVQEVLAAEQRIRPFIRETPVERSRWLSQLTGCDVHLKFENLQYSGSFKARGALNKLLILGESASRGVVAASAGNHGAGIAYAADTLRGTGTVFVPEHVTAEQKDFISSYGVQVITHGEDCLKTEIAARRHAGDHGLPYISPYNDHDVIAGQGTISVELVRQLGDFDAVFLALGGGGLVSGAAGYLKSVQPDMTVVACSPLNSPVMHLSIEAGTIIELPEKETLSHSTAGGIERDAVTLEICRQVVDQRVLVTEDEIGSMMRMFLDRQHMLIEGAAAVSAGGLLKESAHFADRKVVVVICGANVSRAQLAAVCSQPRL